MHRARWSRRRALRLVGLGLLGLSAVLFTLPHSASATTNGITVQAGLGSPFSNDGTPASPDVDITALSDTYQNGQITLTLRTADPTDPTASASSYFVNWGIWVDGNSDPDKLNYVVEFGNDGAGDEGSEIVDANSDVESCTPVASFAGQQFSMTFPATCIGSPTSIEVAAFTETLAAEVPTDITFDVAPNDSTACCEATDTESTTSSTTTTSGVPSSSTTTTSAPTTTSTTAATSGTTTSTTTSTSTTSSTTSTTTTTSTTSTVPASSTTTSGPSTTSTTTATTAPAGVATTTTTTGPATLASSTGASGGGGDGTSSDSPLTAEPNGSASLALTGINSTALKWLLLLGGLLLVGGSMGRRATRKKKSPWQARTLLVLLLAIAGAAMATQTRGSGTNVAPQQSLPHVPRGAAAFGPRLFARSHRPSPEPGTAADLDGTTAEATESPNWSGYVIPATKAAPITDIQGSWTIPNVALSWAPTYSSTWIGLGGGVEGDEALAQEGTEQDSLYGFTDVSSWWSTEGQDYLGIPFTQDQDGDLFATNPGDAMSAEVQQSSGQVFFTLIDNSTGQIASTVTDYQGSGRSAEWIVEAPSLADESGGLSVTTLADYGSTVFDNLGIDQESGGVDLSASEAILMQQNGVVTSYPSAPSASGDAFALAYGSSQPSPPVGDTPLITRSETPRQNLRLATPEELSLLRGRFVSP